MLGYSDCGTQKCRAMRVIAGKYRSRPLRSLRGMDIRPTSDRLRETLFNVLSAGNPEALAGTVWLDLFAGTGAVGVEGMSRGPRRFERICRASGLSRALQLCSRNSQAPSDAWREMTWWLTWCLSIPRIGWEMLIRR